MLHLFAGLELYTSLMLLMALILVLIYEFINGFHDTSNAVATIIYTRSLRSPLAVIMSGIFNFLGVLMGGLSVAYAIVHLIPIHLLMNITSISGIAMMFSMLLSAILWNVGTWYFGIPASSSHTLIGAIIGTGLANAITTDNSVIAALNISKLIEIILSLIISPLVGLILSGLMILFIRKCFKENKKYYCIHLTPEEREKKYGKNNPPFWPRIALIFSSASVSFSHGANDGQKGIGLIMLILMNVAPAGFIVNMNASSNDINRTYNAITYLHKYYIQYQSSFKKTILTTSTYNNIFTQENFTAKLYDTKISKKIEYYSYDVSQIIFYINCLSFLIENLETYDQLNLDQRFYVRYLLMMIADSTEKMEKFSCADKKILKKLRKDILNTIEYAPTWIIVFVALSLSLGTMIGWQRVVITIGEKIGKKGMTYAQGLSAQITASISIGIASYTGMPVSTTHVLSSAVTGTMLVDGSGIQIETIKNILITWILTVPVSMILSGVLYSFFLRFL